MSWWRSLLGLETRADSSYTDALVAAITANAAGQTTAFPTATAALEACAGFVGRSFAAAEVTGPEVMRRALSPDCMSLIGRSLIRRGELVLLIRVSRGEVELWPAASHDVGGGPDPAGWRYTVTCGGPSGTLTFKGVPPEGLIHLAYGRDPERPWRGYGPLQVAQLAGRLSAETIAALADESSGPRANLVPIPVDGDDSTVDELRVDIKNAKGAALLVENGDWGTAGSGGQATSWMAKRLGANPPASLVEQAKLATMEVYAACGLSAALFDPRQGTAGREAYRQALFGLIAPLGRIVSQELSEKLEADIKLDWTELKASDIAGRARAFQSLVGGGMALQEAAAVSGVLTHAD